MKFIYSTNIRNRARINEFFYQIGFTPVYATRTEPAAIGFGEEVIRFNVEGFSSRNLEGRLLNQWRRLPIEQC